MVYFGFINFLSGFGSFRMPSLTPIAYWYAAIPLSGMLIVLFAAEQLINGWRRGFVGAGSSFGATSVAARKRRPMNNAAILALMTFLFLFLGYFGVPVAFSLMAGVLVGTCSLRSRCNRSSASCSTASIPKP